MPEQTMGAVESRFADLIWDNEPITAAELARLADPPVSKSCMSHRLKKLLEYKEE